MALLLAILHPKQVRAVVADSTVERFPPGWLEQSVAERQQRAPGQVEFWQAAHGADWEAVVEADSDMLLRFSRQGGDAFRGRLAQIRCPVLFTGSLRDPLLPDPGGQMVGMARQVHGSQVYLAAEGHHPLMWSRPAEFRRACQACLEALAPSAIS